jgi:hypothetical protein
MELKERKVIPVYEPEETSHEGMSVVFQFAYFFPGNVETTSE